MAESRKKIALLTTGRQDWGILRSIAQKLEKSDDFELYLIAGGMACSEAFGNIARLIEHEGFKIHFRMEWNVDSAGISAPSEISVAILMAERCFKDIQPDALMLLGDRFETLAIAQVAVLMDIPIIHLHGGEETRGARDNQIRHAITKLSHIHFVSNAKHAERLFLMGENPRTVHIVGAPGLDNIGRTDLPSFQDVLSELALNPAQNEPVFLVTYHSPTLIGNARNEIESLFGALEQIDCVCIFTMPNNDSGSNTIRLLIKDFVDRFPKKRVAVNALGEKRYWTIMKHADIVIGNSSSGIIEAPAIPVPVINIGQRQSGREMAPCVVNVPHPDTQRISDAIKKCLSPRFKQSLSNEDSLYGNGGSSEKIYKILKSTKFDTLKKKRFFYKKLHLPAHRRSPPAAKLQQLKIKDSIQ